MTMTLEAQACYWEIFHSGQDLLQLQHGEYICEPGPRDGGMQLPQHSFVALDGGARLAFCKNNNSIC